MGSFFYLWTGALRRENIKEMFRRILGPIVIFVSGFMIGYYTCERLKQRSDLNELEIQRKELLKQLQLAVKRSRSTIDNLKQNTDDSNLRLKNNFVTGKL